jgi:hypothetical protein
MPKNPPNAHVIVTSAAELYHGRLRSINLIDPNVTDDSNRAQAFTLRCSFAIQERRINVRASSTTIAVEIDAADLVERPLSIGKADVIMCLKPVSDALVSIGIPVFSEDGTLRGAEWTLLRDQEFVEHLQDIIDAQMNSVHVYGSGVVTYLQPGDLKSVNKVIDRTLSVINRLEKPAEIVQVGSLPQSLQSIQPFIAEWSIADDDAREEKIALTTRAELIRIATVLSPFLPLINRYLDDDPAGELAAELQALGETISEIQVFLGSQPGAPS